MDYVVTTLEQLRPILLGFRKAKSLTQAALAARLGITQQSYAQLEANPAAASVERLFKVLQLLGAKLVLTDASSVAVQHDSTHDELSTTSPRKVAQTPQPYALPNAAPRPKKPSSAPSKPGTATARKREAW